MTLPHGRHLPILQAVIDNKTPPVLIKKTIHGFAETINTVDSHGRYPIDLAVHHKLAWGDGMKEIVETFASTQQTTTFHAYIKHGVQLENGTKEVLRGSDVDIVEREDISIGLYPFMVAAVEESYGYGLASTFHSIKATPKLVKEFGGNCGDEQCCSKKRQKCV
mmetsp:Transcript_24186/g.36024  ORF Transcript_24186/g.36024 Transcript_24186/m.36024 type:complete len:164 (-) Transcript_24186:40-531(-)